MAALVECVPNFSEGREQRTIERVVAAVRGVRGARVLNVEPDPDYNRTVLTFVAPPEVVGEAAFRATEMAVRLIDMKTQKGEHPRLGAMDVVPFIPVREVTMDACIEIALRFASRVSRELKVPVYLYEAAATSPERRNLSTIRRGEYEGLEKKMAEPAWHPDFGTTFNARSGATVAGARPFLIAYNVNLETSDKAVAHEIALRIRESGRPKRDATGKTMKDAGGSTISIPGSLKAVKAMGVELERAHIAQVSINLVDFRVTPPHLAFEEVKRQAAELGTSVTGSEIVGLVPLDAMIAAGHFYAGTGTLPEKDLVELAIHALGLSQLDRFEPKAKIIEYLIEEHV